MAHSHLLLEGVMICCIPACALCWHVSGIHCQNNEEIFKHLKQVQRMRSQSRLKNRADFRCPWKREKITPMLKMTQGPCYHYLMLQQSFQIFTKEDSRATWKNTLLDKLLFSPDQRMKKLEQMEEDNL